MKRFQVEFFLIARSDIAFTLRVAAIGTVVGQ